MRHFTFLEGGGGVALIFFLFEKEKEGGGVYLETVEPSVEIERRFDEETTLFDQVEANNGRAAFIKPLDRHYFGQTHLHKRREKC